MANNCGCVYSSYDGDESPFYDTSRPKARKPHRCCECRETIPVGDCYERTTGKWNESLETYKTCLACAEIRQLLCCEGWNYTALWEDVREYFHQGGNPMGCINTLESAAAKTKLADEYRDFLGLDAEPVAAPDAPQEHP